jgi:hypothetical protein
MSDKFEQWGIVEIMGHQIIAGKISEQAIGGTSFVRVDVPETKEVPAFTKMFGSGAIYAITVTDEETAVAAAKSFLEKPIDTFSAREMLRLESSIKSDAGKIVLMDDDDRPIESKSDLPF